MSYCRKQDDFSDLYLYHEGDHICCWACPLNDWENVHLKTRTETLAHILAHKDNGDLVPDGVREEIAMEILTEGDRVVSTADDTVRITDLPTKLTGEGCHLHGEEYWNDHPMLPRGSFCSACRGDEAGLKFTLKPQIFSLDELADHPKVDPLEVVEVIEFFHCGIPVEGICPYDASMIRRLMAEWAIQNVDRIRAYHETLK